MKFSSQEEYGLRLLLRIAKYSSTGGMTIPELSEAEGLSSANTAKLLRLLRMGGYIDSVRGMRGGYKLSRAPRQILVADVLNDLGGRLFNNTFCTDHSGVDTSCTHDIDCSVRVLWSMIQRVVDGVLKQTTLADLMLSESLANQKLSPLVDDSINAFTAVKEMKLII
ncbi:MAG: Rrf2 family transcriptional regulator [Ignavibacteriales bacterium]|nr:Rrf2 family transcriptional regulator [Ignavibacteriales bacterium]